MENSRKRKICLKWGIPILVGLVFGVFFGWITKTLLGGLIGFFLGFYPHWNTERKKEVSGNSSQP